VEVLRRLRRASLAALRREIEPAERRAFAAFLPAWQAVDRHAAAGAGVERLREQLVPLQGLALTPSTWEREVLPRRVGAYSTTWMDELCANGEVVWVGAGAFGRADGRVALYFREDVGLLGPPPRRGELPPEADTHARVRARLKAEPCFFADLLSDVELPAPELVEVLWDLVWAGVLTNDAFAPLRAPRPTPRTASPSTTPLSPAPPARSTGMRPRQGLQSGMPRRGGHFAGRRAAGRMGGSMFNLPGRWSLTAPLFAAVEDASSTQLSDRLRALTELLLERYGILTRELVLAEGVKGGFAALYPELCRLETLGVARRGYFVEGLGGAQFALPGAVERLRGDRRPVHSSDRSPVHSSDRSSIHCDDRSPARPAIDTPATRAGASPSRSSTLVLAATDPAQPYGAALPWPRQEQAPVSGRQAHASETAPATGRAETVSGTRRSSPARVPGASVVLVDAEPVLYLERGGRALRVLADPACERTPSASTLPRSDADPEDERVQRALAALAEHARAGRLPTRIALERVEGEPVLGSRWESALERAGFRVGPRRVELGAG
jgi:ATP-dependent Lhr-like helicase